MANKFHFRISSTCISDPTNNGLTHMISVMWQPHEGRLYFHLTREDIAQVQRH